MVSQLLIYRHTIMQSKSCCKDSKTIYVWVVVRVAVAAKENQMYVEPAGVGGGLQNFLGEFNSHNVLQFLVRVSGA